LWHVFLEDGAGDKLLKPVCVEGWLMDRYGVLHTDNSFTSETDTTRTGVYATTEPLGFYCINFQQIVKN